MKKTSTQKHAEIKQTKEKASFNQLPNPQIIKNALNFSKALSVKKTKTAGEIAVNGN